MNLLTILISRVYPVVPCGKGAWTGYGDPNGNGIKGCLEEWRYQERYQDKRHKLLSEYASIST
ncbi:predicted protein [Sclerotinia sclerotiorum 1980 UF-70]|uniref:Uncharacterized protein n=1 Tax=Sclerotinia sclerotiorum (strain ATCC 18683 / 1980 / Ss-1) TaxID=665079 RepID=A7EAV0_SCLS1|nr:predicted protein [Sclerotinia sclerotiorum 1980 UF-70]EDN99578.1 predicted protein [Sclerotinia sclerotiorum 1980 UF-70]